MTATTRDRRVKKRSRRDTTTINNREEDICIAE
jgi:hypothetical protein